MQELSKIIISRINDIKVIENMKVSTNQYVKNKAIRQIFLSQKMAQSNRIRKQTQLMAIIDSPCYKNSVAARQLYFLIKSIIFSYDRLVQQSHIKQQSPIRLFRLIHSFFMRNNFQQKIPEVIDYAKQNQLYMDSRVILSWLSQWSKKKYFRLVQSELGVSQYKIQGNCSNISEKQPNLHMKHIYNPFMELRNPKLSKNCQKKDSKSCEYKDNEQQKIKRLNIFSKNMLHCYLVNQLMDYYSLCGNKEVLDMNYLKNLVKKSKGNNLIGTNLKEAVSRVIGTQQNRQICRNIKEYEQQYKNYRTRQVQKKRQKQKTSSLNINIPQKEQNKRYFQKKVHTSLIDQSKNRFTIQLPKQTDDNQQFKFRHKTNPISSNKTNNQITPPRNKSMQKSMKLPQIGIKYKNNKQPNIIELKSYLNIPSTKSQYKQYCKQQGNKSRSCQRKPQQGQLLREYLSSRQKKLKLYIDKNNRRNIGKINRKNKIQLIINQSHQYCSENSIINSSERLQKVSPEYPKLYEIQALRKKTQALLKNWKAVQQYK